MAERIEFRAHLQRGGIGLREMQRLLEAYAEHGDWGRVRELVRQENFLGKTSDYAISAVLKAFRRRFISDLGLPPVDLVAQMMVSKISQLAKVQILLPYYLLSDPLIQHCYHELVLKRLNSERPTLTSAEVHEYLTVLGEKHGELARWSDYLRRRWARAFLTLLRHFGLMEPHPRTKLQKLWLLPEPFGFFYLWFWERNGSFWRVRQEELWVLLQLDEKRWEELLSEGQLRGWWVYQRSGDIVQFRPIYDHLEEWLRDGLA